MLDSAVRGTGGGGGWNGRWELIVVGNNLAEKSSSGESSDPSCARAAELARLIAVAREDCLKEPVAQLSRIELTRDSRSPMIVRSMVLGERCCGW